MRRVRTTSFARSKVISIRTKGAGIFSSKLRRMFGCRPRSTASPPPDNYPSQPRSNSSNGCISNSAAMPEGVPIYRLELIGLRGQRIEIFSPQVADSDIVSVARLDTHRSADGVHRRQTSSTRRYKTRRYKTCFSTTLTCKNTSSSRGLLLAGANPKHAPVPARKGTRHDSPRKPAHGNPTRKSDLRGQTAPAGGPEGRSRSSDSYHLSSFRLPARDIVEALVVEIQQTRPSSKAFPEISTSRSS